MKSYLKLITPALALCTLLGCSGSGTVSESSQQPAETAPVTEPEEIPTEKYDVGGVVPVLSIETVSRDENVMDFVNKPVARHVAKSIASWTPNYKMPPEPYYEDCTVTLRDADDTVLLDGVGAQVKVRGNWTTTYDKKPLRIKFEQKQSVLGLNGGAEMKNWVLLAEYKDGSMLRDKSALAIAREILGEDGLYAADAAFVEVEINGEYRGMYLLTELQQVNSDRIDVTEPEKDYTGTDIGYFLEFDGYFTNEDELHSFFVDYADNAPLTPYDGEGGSGKTIKCLSESPSDHVKDVGFTIKSDIYSQEQHDFIAGFVNGVYDIMYAAAYEDKAYAFTPDHSEIVEVSDITPQQAVENVVDVNSLADMYIISELTCDADIYWSSFFMDADFGENGSKKLRFEAPWDFDSGMGNKDRCADGTGFYAANIVPDVNGGPKGGGEYETVNPWLAVLMYEDWFQDIIREKWTSAYDGGTFDRALQMIENDKTELSEAFTRNYKRWNNLVNNSSFRGELSRDAARCKTHEEAADQLAKWLGSRVEFMNGHWHV